MDDIKIVNEIVEPITKGTERTDLALIVTLIIITVTTLIFSIIAKIEKCSKKSGAKVTFIGTIIGLAISDLYWVWFSILSGNVNIM